MAKKKNVPARKPTVRKAVRKTITKTAAISAGAGFRRWKSVFASWNSIPRWDWPV